MIDIVVFFEFVEYIMFCCGMDIVLIEVVYGELIVIVMLFGLIDLIEYLCNDVNCWFLMLIDIMVVDNLQCLVCFDLVYYFLLMFQNYCICVKVQLCEDEIVFSLIGVFFGVNWYECEIFDMFGILFLGYFDLCWIFIDYGFCGYLLCKDFLIMGYIEVCWNDVEKCVVYELVKLVQEYWQFDFLLLWEGVKYVFSGDEKVFEVKK